MTIFEVRSNYMLMSLDTELAEVIIDDGRIIGEVTFINRDQLPFAVKDKSSLAKWFESRRIPASRTHLSDLEMKLGMSGEQLLEKSFALSLSDSFWIKPLNQPELKWADVNFFDNDFSDDVGEFLIKGDGPIRSLVTPSNTTDGVFPKKWIIKNGFRYLVKKGDVEHAKFDHLNEIFAYKVGRLLNISTTPYFLLEKDNSCMCPNFIKNGQNLVSAYEYLSKQGVAPKDGREYPELFEPLSEPFGSRELQDMLLLDYIIFNKDRHMKNFGFIQDARTGELISPAPIYDCGSSLFYCISLWKELPFDNNLFLSRPFYSNHETQLELVDLKNYKDQLDNLNNKFYDTFMSVYEKCGAQNHHVDGMALMIQKRIDGLRNW